MQEQLTYKPTAEHLGTFQDNHRAPIHHGLNTLTGFNYKLAETIIDEKFFGPGIGFLTPL